MVAIVADRVESERSMWMRSKHRCRRVKAGITGLPTSWETSQSLLSCFTQSQYKYTTPSANTAEISR